MHFYKIIALSLSSASVRAPAETFACRCISRGCTMTQESFASPALSGRCFSLASGRNKREGKSQREEVNQSMSVNNFANLRSDHRTWPLFERAPEKRIMR